MRLQTDLEFQQNQIKILKEKCNVEMFSSRGQGRRTYDAEQKIRVLKKLYLRARKRTRQVVVVNVLIQKN